MSVDYQSFLQSKAQLAGHYGFDPEWMPDFLFDFQQHLVEWATRKGRSAILADCGLGKGQPEGAMILTPSGFIPNTSLEPGGMVIASDGAAYPLKAKYLRGIQETFRVHFSDGSSFVVDADHLHILRTHNDRQRGKPWRVVSTRELLKMPIRYGSGSKSRNLDIPVVAPIQGDRREHWIHPYVLGVLLGDGCITKGCTVTLADAQIIETVRALLPAGWTLTHKSRYDYKLSHGGKNNRDLVQELRRLGIFGTRSSTKFIPSEYLFDSVDNRVWLLRGLMDTDGYIKDTSQFYSTSGLLTDGVLQLIRSLGGVPTRTTKQTSCMHKGYRRKGAMCHVLTFSLKTFNPFHLARKAAKWNPSPRDNGRWIDRIEPCGKQRTICLSVGSPDQSYVTENYIVTHNTPMQLVWAENVVRRTNRRVLILTPLAVSAQTVSEAEKFGIEAVRSHSGELKGKIVVTNYERLGHMRPDDFVGVVCDESSILKNFNGKRKAEVTEFMRTLPYRLLCTATAAPNDYDELGTSSEALGEFGYQDMLTRFFSKGVRGGHRAWSRAKYTIKGHAEHDFWRWVVSWARAVRKPSDLGFDDRRFILPELRTFEHIVEARTRRPGTLFDMPASDLLEQKEERRRTIQERCEKVAELSDHDRPVIAWCHLNPEGDMLERMIPDAVQVSGSDSDEAKEERFMAFVQGQIRVLVTKPVIAGFGLNFQHCAHQTFFPSHSFEQWYQAIRRSLRFGQENPVRIDMISSEGEAGVLANLQRKSVNADAMFERLVSLMNDHISIARTTNFNEKEKVPAWL